MKYLFLLLIIACGQSTPSPQKQLLDASEASVSTYKIPDHQRVQALGPVSLTLRHETTDYEFTNSYDYENKILDAIVTRPDPGSENFFSEWSTLRSTSGGITLQGEKASYKAELKFTAQKILPYALYFVIGDEETFLGLWEKTMTVYLLPKHRSALAQNQGFFTLKKLPAEEQVLLAIAQNSIRLHLPDQIVYVSKDSNFTEALLDHGINGSSDLTDLSTYLFSNGNTTQTFLKKISDHEYAAVTTTDLELKQRFLSRAKKVSTSLVRAEGSAAQPVTVKSSRESRGFLRIRANKTVRAFQDYYDHGDRPAMGGGWRRISCMNHMRKVHSASTTPATVDDLRQSLSILIGGQSVEYEIIEGADNNGKIFDVTFSTSLPDYQVALKALDTNTFVDIGPIRMGCAHAQRKKERISPEESLSLELMTFN